MPENKSGRGDKIISRRVFLHYRAYHSVHGVYLIVRYTSYYSCTVH